LDLTREPLREGGGTMSQRIIVNYERPIGRLSPLIFGSNINNFGRCIYGGIFEENSSLSDKHGFRKDVLEAARQLKCSILRWPGGPFANSYHWEDGIGPRAKRPVRLDFSWNREETNAFGTDEYIEYCRMIGSEPYIIVNIGTSNLRECIDWLEYCNLDGNTSHAKLRSRNSIIKPYKVKYWGIGNEPFLDWQIGYRSSIEYAKVLKEYARVMKKCDPEIEIIGAGANNPEWDIEVIRHAGEFIDYISNHQFYGSDDYCETIGFTYRIEKNLRILNQLINIYQPVVPNRKKIKIAFDEWNIFYKTRHEDGAEESYALKDGLFAAGVFMVLYRMCNSVSISNICGLVNVIGMIHTERHGLFLTPIYKAAELFSNHRGSIVLETYVQSQTLCNGQDKKSSDNEDIPSLDAVTTLDDRQKKLFIAVANYYKDKNVNCSIHIDGPSLSSEGKYYELNGCDVDAENDSVNPENITIKQGTLGKISNCFDYEFPSHSCTIIEIGMS
jgi:alpha-N-arabinofuranosidase